MKRNLIFFAGFRPILGNNNVLVIHAGTTEKFMRDAVITAVLDGKEVPVRYEVRDNNRARYCYKSENIVFSCEYQFMIDVPDKFSQVELFVTFSEIFGNEKVSYKVKSKHFNRMKKIISGTVDSVRKDEGEVTLSGWCAAAGPVKVSIYDGNTLINCDVSRLLRVDIADYYLEDELKDKAAGFIISFPQNNMSKVSVVFEADGIVTTKKVSLNGRQGSNGSIATDRIGQAWAYFRQRGFSALVYKVVRKLLGINVFDYDHWIKNHETDERELKYQRSKKFDREPLFSIIVPVYRPKAQYFQEMIESVMNQTYSNWELCLADGSGEGHYMDGVVKKYAKGDLRVKYTKLEGNLGISGNTNKALEMTTGDYIVLGDHDDIFRPDALYEFALALNHDDTIDIMYTDEDKYDCDKKKRIEPNFKPDYNLDMLRNNNYICHIFVFSRAIYEKVGGFNSEFDGSQDYDMIFRCTEHAKNIKHIPKVLYSWRCHAGSTASNPESKNYAFEAGLRALDAHLERAGVKARTSMMEIPGYHKIVYDVIGNPKVSIIIPNKDHTEDLDKCIRSIAGKQNYTNYEIIIVENNSTEKKTFKYYEDIQKELSCVRVVFWKEEFNYSKINNFGCSFATGEYLLLLNNDTEMIREDCLRELLSFSTRPEVGIVGARLLYDDGSVQHAGVILGLGGVAGHAFAGILGDNKGYFARAIIPQDYCAVTAACLMVRKSIYDEVGGFEEKLVVAFNDVDFCLKVYSKGYLVVYNPGAELYHYESKSRGYEDTPEKIKRFQKETDFLLTKWKTLIDNGDPNYNVNLSLTRADFMPKE